MKKLDQISKKEFSVPSGYFDDFAQSVTDKLERDFREAQNEILKKTVRRRGRIYSLYAGIAASAAAIALGIVIVDTSTRESDLPKYNFQSILDSSDFREEDVIPILNHEDLAYLFLEEVERIPVFEIEKEAIIQEEIKTTSELDSISSDEILEYLEEESTDILIY